MRFFLVIILVLISDNSFAAAKKPPVQIQPPVIQIPSGEVGKFHFTFKCVSTCTASEVKRIDETQSLIEKFINSKCFDGAWLSFKRLEQTNGLKNQGIIDKIRASHLKDIPIIFYWPTWKQSKNVIGYTYPSSPEIYLNRSFRAASYWTAWSEASNLFHESLHKIGFGHDSASTERRPYSVPYSGNRAVELCEGKI